LAAEIVHDLASFNLNDDLTSFATGDKAPIPHRTPFFEIIIIDEMDGRIVIDEATYENSKNRVFLLCPGQNRSWQGVSRIKGAMVTFGEEFLHDVNAKSNAVWELNIFKEMNRYIMLALSEEEHVEIRRIYASMLRELRQREAEYPATIRAYLNILMILLYRNFESGFADDDSKGYANLCEAFQRLTLIHVGERRSVNFFAAKLNISMGYLNEKVKKQLGVTPGEVIRQTMVSEAKRLIANTDLSMTEVAETLGFDDGSYFCRLFKKEMGMSPIKFRQSCYTISEGKPGSRRRKRKTKKNGVARKKAPTAKEAEETRQEEPAGEQEVLA
jgi:AraC-like DNA-binding protein